MSELLLDLARGVELLCVGLALGRLLFVLAVAREAAPRGTRRLLAMGAVAAVGWLLACCASMAESIAPSTVWRTVTSTSFGHLWSVRVLLLAGAACLYPKWGGGTAGRAVLLVALLGAELAGVMSAHAAQAEGAVRVAKVAVDLAHAVAVGAWGGGLTALVAFLGPSASRPPGARATAIKRFSALATGCALVIPATGLGLAYWSGVGLANVLTEAYGTLVAGKSGLFAAALAVAAVNRFVHVRSLSVVDEAVVARRVAREARIELGLVALAFGVAGVLTRTMPPS